MSMRQPANSSANAPKPITRVMRVARAMTCGVVRRNEADWKLDFNLKYSVWIQAFQEFLRFRQLETLVAHFYHQEKPVVRGQRESRDVEHRMVRRGQAVHRQHSKDGAQCG